MNVTVCCLVLSALVLPAACSSAPTTVPDARIPQQKGVAAEPAVLDPDAPCLQAEAVTLDEVRTQSDFRAYMPNHPLANRENLAGVWSCPVGPGGLLKFSSGVTIYFGDGSFIRDPERLWESRERDGDGSVGTVRGESASLSEPAPEPERLGGVEFVEDSTLLTVSGNGQIPLADLVDVAESLAQI
jgi:hypothetical protein